MRRYIPYILFGSLLAASCSRDNNDVTQYAPMPIERIDLAVSGYPQSAADIQSLEPGIGLYIHLMSADTLNRDDALTALSQNRVTQWFGRDIVERFTVADSLALPLGRVSALLPEVSPELKVTNVYGIASPYMQSVIVSDSTVLVALNHYLGSDYPGYETMPSYVREGKTPTRLPADVAEAVVRVRYPYSPVEGTLLERMLYEGAVAEVVAQATGNDGDALGYSIADLDTADHRLKDVWYTLASDGLLYSTADGEISRLVSPAPFSRVGSIELPSKIGRYIGLQIIRSYIKNHPDAKPVTLLENSFYGHPQQRLIESKFSV
ncbi:MAG: hypothetical protein K2N28_03965 [Muribaculaceae bacterium]|nr:hypothetical protein [Muribaculaceae bacterium]